MHLAGIEPAESSRQRGLARWPRRSASSLVAPTAARSATSGETFFRNLCETCRDKQAAKRRRRTATRVLAKAEDAGNGRAQRRDLHRARATAETGGRGASARRLPPRVPAVGSAHPGGSICKVMNLCASPKART